MEGEATDFSVDCVAVGTGMDEIYGIEDAEGGRARWPFTVWLGPRPLFRKGLKHSVARTSKKPRRSNGTRAVREGVTARPACASRDVTRVGALLRFEDGKQASSGEWNSGKSANAGRGRT